MLVIGAASYNYSIQYRPGKNNAAPGTLARAFCAPATTCNLMNIRGVLWHHGVRRLVHFVWTKTLTFFNEEVRTVCFSYCICSELKLISYKSTNSQLIKATQSLGRVSIAFKALLPWTIQNKYLLIIIIDEYLDLLCLYLS